MALNIATIDGFISTDIEEHQGNSYFISFNVAVDRPYVNKQTGERKADYFNVTVSGNYAKSVVKYLHKGRSVAVTGSFRQRNFDSKTFVYAQGHPKAGQAAPQTGWTLVASQVSLHADNANGAANGGTQMKQTAPQNQAPANQAPATQQYQQAPQTQAPAQNYDQAGDLSANDMPF